MGGGGGGGAIPITSRSELPVSIVTVNICRGVPRLIAPSHCSPSKPTW